MIFLKKITQTLPRPSLFLIYLYALVLFIYGLFFIFGIFQVIIQKEGLGFLALLVISSFVAMPSFLLFSSINGFIGTVFQSMPVFGLIIIICAELILSVVLNFFLLYGVGRIIAQFFPNERMRIASIKSGVALPVQITSRGSLKKYFLLFFIFTVVISTIYLILIFFLA